MIFLDANVFLRHLVHAEEPTSQAMSEDATKLFEQAERDEIEITTSEVVLHEVIYVLSSKRHYNLEAEPIADMLRAVLRLPALRLPRGDKAIYQAAIDLFVAYPRLGFADAVVAARALRGGLDLATFDSDFDRIPELKRFPIPSTS